MVGESQLATLGHMVSSLQSDMSPTATTHGRMVGAFVAKKSKVTQNMVDRQEDLVNRPQPQGVAGR